MRKLKKYIGDNYDYSRVNYIDSKTKVCILCVEHGEFWQTPNDHLSGCGCPKCADIHNGSKKKLTTEQFVERAKAIHRR